MKDQYVGDVNDFAKYQLLRVCATHFGRVVVAWMLTEADGRGDGRHVGYLRDAHRGCADPELFAALAQLVERQERNVRAVEVSPMLPGCVFHGGPLPRALDLRASYFTRLAELGDPETLIFLDPDNGLEVASVPPGTRNSNRYVYWEELGILRESGCSLLVYQHFPRVNRADFVRELCDRMSAELGTGYTVFAAHSSRVGFFFGVRDRFADVVPAAIAQRCAAEPLLTFALPADPPR